MIAQASIEGCNAANQAQGAKQWHFAHKPGGTAAPSGNILSD